MILKLFIKYEQKGEKVHLTESLFVFFFKNAIFQPSISSLLKEETDVFQPKKHELIGIIHTLFNYRTVPKNVD
jgi:hypothetical protein